jgi:outer membrane murein-binding lipoprotein Lpp
VKIDRPGGYLPPDTQNLLDLSDELLVRSEAAQRRAAHLSSRVKNLIEYSAKLCDDCDQMWKDHTAARRGVAEAQPEAEIS